MKQIAKHLQKTTLASDWIFLAAMASVFCLAGLGRGSLASWDEAYYAVVSRDMFLSGDWVRLTYFGNPFFDKPPLYLWCTALAYHAFGITEFATKLPSALSGIGCVFLTYLTGTRLFGRVTGLAGAGLLLTSTDFLHYARWATLDVMALLFFTGTIYAALTADSNHKQWILFWVCSALAVMTKGPLIVLAWMISGCVILIQRNRMPFRLVDFWIGFLVFLVIVLPWHFAAFLSDPDAFWKNFIVKHYIERTTGAVEGHVGSYYFYIRTLINKYHPWIFLAPFGLVFGLYQAIKNKNERASYLIVLGWIAIVFCFFTFLVQTKLKWYILPLHPALSILSAIPMTLWWFPGGSVLLLKMVIVATAAGQVFFSSVYHHDYSPGLKQFAQEIRQTSNHDEKVALYNFHEEPASTFYTNRRSVYTDSLEELDKYQSEFGRLHFIVRKQDYPLIEGELFKRNFKIIDQTSGFREDLIYLK